VSWQAGDTLASRLGIAHFGRQSRAARSRVHTCTLCALAPIQFTDDDNCPGALEIFTNLAGQEF
jgi:hypothetical protein